MNENIDTQEKDNEQDGGSLPIFYIIIGSLLIVFPTVFVAAWGTYFAFKKYKIHPKVILTYVLLPLIIILLPFWGLIRDNFTEIFTSTLPNLSSGTIDLGQAFMELLGHQFLVGIPIGMCVGLFYAFSSLRNQAEWSEIEFKKSPAQILKKRRTIKEIRENRNTPKDSMTLGVDDDGNRVVQTYKESQVHTILIGASGSGKTTTLMGRARDAISVGQGLIFVDMKGGPDIPVKAQELAERFGRKFHHWTMIPKGEQYDGPAPNGPSYYDPISRGEPTRRKDLLIETRTWSEDYYKQESSSLLQIIFNVIVGNPHPDPNRSTFEDIIELLNPAALQQRAIPLGRNPEYAAVIKSIDILNEKTLSPGKKSAIDSLRSQYEQLLLGVAGPYLANSKEHPENNINLFESAHNGDVVVFSIDSSNYEGLASLMGNLIIQDLKTISSQLREKPLTDPVQIVIDEFSAVRSESVMGLINKSRDAQMHVTLATQTLGDFDSISSTFKTRLFNTVTSFIFHRVNHNTDAEYMAGIAGQKLVKDFSESVEYSTQGGMTQGAAAGRGTLHTKKVSEIEPEEIQQLKTGQLIYITSPPRVQRAQFIPEDINLRGNHNTDFAAVNKTQRYNEDTDTQKYAVELEEEYIDYPQPAGLDTPTQVEEYPSQQYNDEYSYDANDIIAENSVVENIEPEKVVHKSANREILNGVLNKKHQTKPKADDTPIAEKPKEAFTTPALPTINRGNKTIPETSGNLPKDKLSTLPSRLPQRPTVSPTTSNKAPSLPNRPGTLPTLPTTAKSLPKPPTKKIQAPETDDDFPKTQGELRDRYDF